VDALNPTDAADVADANAFEELTHTSGLSSVTIPDQEVTNESERVIEIEVENAETESKVIIDHFPSGNPGAPLAAPSVAGGHEAGPHDSVWAPFQSQRDWEFARWAKMRGSTSTAVSDLLAIPEVLPSSFLSIHH
jgi:hypothetical protein